MTSDDTNGDTNGKEARRAAYATYVACFWSLRRLPLDDARRPALAQATQRAESAWRAAMVRTMGGGQPGGVAQSDERRQSHPLSPPLTRGAMQGSESLSADDH